MVEKPLKGQESKQKGTLPGAKFGGGARSNTGQWIPLVDLVDIFAGFRGNGPKGVLSLYDAPVGVQLKVEEAVKSEPILESEMEWEKGKMRPCGLWKENGQYHLIYNSLLATCYAVSDDGYNWIRPELGQVEFNGSRKNNILDQGPKGGIFEDPKGAPEERFKSMSQDIFWVDPDTAKIVPQDEADKRLAAQKKEGSDYKGTPMELRGHLIGWVSPDRLHWTQLKEPVAHFSADSGSYPHYDPDTGYFFDYFRVHAAPPEEFRGVGTGVPELDIRRRSIGFSRTKDFRDWPPPKLVLFPDAQDDMDVSFYGTQYFRYPGRSDLHGMLLAIFHQVEDIMDAQLAFSRDGLFWSRPERRAIVPVGDPGSGDDCMTYAATTLIDLPDGYWGSLYRGGSRLHGVWPDQIETLFPQYRSEQIRWARWLPHRFCGFEAKEDGSFTILSIRRTKKELHLNYRCKAGGWISVELINRTPSATSSPSEGIPGFKYEECDLITGDSLDHVITWEGKSDISEVGETVAIRIKMFRAKLFAYMV